MRTGQRLCAVSTFAALAVGVLLSGPGCGSSPSSPSSSFPLSQSSIETAVKNFARGASNATNTGTSFGFRGLDAPGFSGTDRFLAAPVQMTTYQVNQPFSQRTNCDSGGYHETSGRITGTINSEGISYLQMNATQSINNYRCVANGWVVNGDPYISNAGSISVNGSRSSFDFSQSLGWKATNESSGTTVSCQHSIRVVWDNLTGGSASGNVSCTPPQQSFSVTIKF